MRTMILQWNWSQGQNQKFFKKVLRQQVWNRNLQQGPENVKLVHNFWRSVVNSGFIGEGRADRYTRPVALTIVPEMTCYGREGR